MGSELVVQNLTVRYGAVLAAESVSLTVKPGECVVLLGANGAGKTSTLHGIGGLTPSIGTVRLGDVELGHLSASKRARAGLGHVLEGRHVFPGMTVAENLDVARSRSGAKPPVEPLELLPELKEHLARAAGRLSGGQQQMLAIARAVAGAPQAIMLDEPTNGLAPKLVARTTEIIATLRDLGYAVLVVEQRLEVAQTLAADVLVLRHGHIVHEVKGTDPTLPDLLHAAYLS
ncbi:ABC-type branched-subunit amino acid transport system ATPase component [Microbacterium trichothecenolyticum]|uniref:ABC transporter ATP-binding protein n=1 Tax=Microbacterium trichothecenolyticum TaxID=69370 RepID=UPI002862479F|nr:ATP-binding cassette domain-containing protein [Microbacterium trichothecenolyticum]MDR7112246.1 ABC-type branched-subunit amino acid transport system ATPase component [Microbacterium trichothecenolyticum]